MSKFRAMASLPVVGTLAALFYLATKKAEQTVNSMHGDDVDGPGLGKFKIKRPSVKAIVKTALNPVEQVKLAQSVADKNKTAGKVMRIAQTSVNPLMQLRAGRDLASKNKTTGKLFRVAQTFGNPIMQAKLLKDTVKDGYSGKNKIAQWALLASDPVFQQKYLKSATAKMKQGGGSDGAPADESLTFPYEIEPGIFVDKDGNRVNTDGTPYIYPETPASSGNDYGQEDIFSPSAASGADPNAPYFVEELGLWYNPADDSYYNAETGQYYDGYMNPVGNAQAESVAAPQSRVSMNAEARANDPNAPYFDPDSGLWYSPADDSYYDPRSKTYYDGYLNKIDKKSYLDQPGSDEAGHRPEDDSETPYYDADSGFIYDPASDTYFDPKTGQHYDGWLNAINENDVTLQGLGSLGRMRVHVAKGALRKGVGIASMTGAVVGCAVGTIYGAGAVCAPLLGVGTVVLKNAYETKKNAKDDELRQRQAQDRAQFEFDKNKHADVIANNQRLASQQGPAVMRPFPTPENPAVWYDPKSDTYYDTVTQQYYNPGTHEYQPVTASEGPAVY